MNSSYLTCALKMQLTRPQTCSTCLLLRFLLRTHRFERDKGLAAAALVQLTTLLTGAPPITDINIPGEATPLQAGESNPVCKVFREIACLQSSSAPPFPFCACES